MTEAENLRCIDVLLRLNGYPAVRDINPGAYLYFNRPVSDSELLRLQMSAAAIILERLGLRTWQI